MIKIVLVDAANTLIHKPLLWRKIVMVFEKHNIQISVHEIMQKHKLVSELINFPDRTNVDFYHSFNSELLMALGLIPNEIILSDLFEACTYLPWEAFDDSPSLEKLNCKKAVLSNFNSGLGKILEETIPFKFDEIIVSEIEKVRKPQIEFYEQAISKLKVLPSEILYIGDSIKLDVVPAQIVGMNTLLIDREHYYSHHKQRINSFVEVEQKIKELKLI